ncbi:MAG TPA: hypothetical protein VK623_06795 [Flavobacterium sp.]|nr:hypothetical protein [Flavobacterium sp.]
MSYTVEELIVRLKEFPKDFVVTSKGHFVGNADINYVTSNNNDTVTIHISRPTEKAVVEAKSNN